MFVSFINDVTNNLINFSYNKIIANLHEIYSQLTKINSNKYSKKALINNYGKILIVMMPVLPHFSSESLKLINYNSEIKWPDIDKELLKDKIISYVIQINGKKRGLINANSNLKEEELIEIIKKDVNIKKYLDNKIIRKKIFIPNKLINVIL